MGVFPIYLNFKAINIWLQVSAHAEMLNHAFLWSLSSTENKSEK